MRAGRLTDGPSASATAAIPPTTIRTAGTHPSWPGLLPRTISSVAMPAPIASGPMTRAGMPPFATTAMPAPTSAAVNGASSDT